MTLRKADNSAVDVYEKALPAFDGFPYLAVHLCPAFYQVMLMPELIGEAASVVLAKKQACANKLPMCLVFGSRHCAYLDGTGAMQFSASIPRGGVIADRGLLPGWDCDDSEAFQTRERELRAYTEARNAGKGFMMGDQLKGGRDATREELRELAGVNAFGVPKGLEQCPECRYWRGVCLDPNPRFAGMIMPVDCLCANNNRCVRCGDLLYRYKLNANFFNTADGQIWHAAGYCGFHHRCSGTSGIA